MALGTDMGHHFARVRLIPMLEKINPLPCTKTELALHDRDGDGNRCQGRFDMGGHVVGAFVCVGQIGHAGIRGGRHQTGKEISHIGLHFRIGIFLNEDRAGCVLHKQVSAAL